ncbi:MAG TPA: NAD(P)/FAD-dependent oxidoreductase, partial [Methylophilaceae bacterium]|nr:NAD(P)/FAD-dependent oxidoreductase [Methylophilaceae bacterium]
MQDNNEITQAWDCLIVGGGPGGLTAAVYLARYRRRVALIDNGGSRAALIPLSRNLPGCAQGLAGEEFLRCLRAQAAQYQVHVLTGTVLNLQHVTEGFAAQIDDGYSVRARAVLLATG